MNRVRNKSRSAPARRTVTLKACATPRERTAIEALARTAGVSVSRFLIDSATGGRVPRRSRTADAVVRKNQIILGLARHLDHLTARLLRHGTLDAIAIAAHIEVTAAVLRAASLVERTAKDDGSSPGA